MYIVYNMRVRAHMIILYYITRVTGYVLLFARSTRQRLRCNVIILLLLLISLTCIIYDHYYYYHYIMRRVYIIIILYVRSWIRDAHVTYSMHLRPRAPIYLFILSFYNFSIFSLHLFHSFHHLSLSLFLSHSRDRSIDGAKPLIRRRHRVDPVTGAGRLSAAAGRPSMNIQ